MASVYGYVDIYVASYGMPVNAMVLLQQIRGNVFCFTCAPFKTHLLVFFPPFPNIHKAFIHNYGIWECVLLTQGYNLLIKLSKNM